MGESSSVFVVKPEVRRRMVGGQAVLVQQQAGAVLAVNEVGARILDLLDGRMTTEEIVKALEAEFDAPARQLALDAGAFLERLVDLGIVEEVR